MNKRLKIVLKLCLCFLVTTLINVSCTKDDDFTGKPSEENGESLVKRITLEDLKQRIGNNTNNYSKLKKLFDVNKGKLKPTNIQSRNLQDENPWLITDEIMMVEKQGYATYTFRIGTETETQEFYNLVATIDDDGNIISTRVLEYNPNASWLANSSQPYSGKIKLLNNDIFSSDDILNIMSNHRFYTCVTGINHISTCNLAEDNGRPANGHYNGHPACTNGTSWTVVNVLQYGTCYEPDPVVYNDVTFDPGSGSAGGGTTGSGSGTNTTNDCVPTIGNPCDLDHTVIMMPDEPEEIPCENQDDDINALNSFLSDQNINNKVTYLETVANQNSGSEEGQEYQQNLDGSFTPIDPIATGPGETTFPDAAGNSVLRIHAHTNDLTHSPSWNDTFAAWPAFLHQQIVAANSTFQNSLTNELTLMVVSKSGIIAFRVKDLAEIANMYSFYAGLDEDSSEKHAKASALLKWENQYKIEAVKDCQFNGGCTDNEYQEKIVKKWLEKIKKNKLGTSTYRATKDVNGDYQWECLN